jgi:hypothetical protein
MKVETLKANEPIPMLLLKEAGIEEDKIIAIVGKSGIILAKEPRFFIDMLRGLVKRAEYDKSEYLDYILERSE